MLETFTSLSPMSQVLIATAFTWGMTALGASLVFITKSVNRQFMNGMLGFAAGVMIAASIWSLLDPAIQMSRSGPLPAWLPAAIGFTVGVLAISSIDRILPHLHIGLPEVKAEGIKTHWRQSVLLMLAITLHNFPEGLAIGVVFGGMASGAPAAALPLALILTLGLGIQNIPEGMAISFPLHRQGMTRGRSFWYGQLSALTEPLGGVIGVVAVTMVNSLLPYAFGFAAGAMMFVVVEELIPESQQDDHPDIATLGTMAGFLVMMILDVAFT
ncbi:MAG: ZIP family metal transporter [Candidatus Brocadiia bacterium]